MIKYSLQKKIISSGSFMLLSTLLLIFSCNKPFPNTLKNDNTGVGTTNTVVPKTLLIVVDGAVGSEVRDANPPTLNSLIDFSIYSWDGLGDYSSRFITNQFGWANLLTGASSAKHNVTGNDFSGNNFSQYPSMFTRLKQSKPSLRTSAFCASQDLSDNLAVDATERKAYAEDDAAVKEGAKAELASKDPAFMLVQFHSVDKAGMASAYSSTSTAYKTAILQVDSYIGEILTAMRARPSFKYEKWMVIVTSNKGNNTPFVTGSTPYNGFLDKQHNTFFFCYNPRFNSQNPTKPGAIVPYLGVSPNYSGTQSQNQRAKVLDGGATYDFGSTGNFTIQCKVKFPTGNINYPAFLSKRDGFKNGVVGWVLFRENDFWQINFGQTGRGNLQVRGQSVSDGQWHTLTAVIRQEGAARNVYTFTDGVLYPNTGAKDLTNWGNINSPAPLTVGNLPPDNNTGLGNYFVTDIRIYNTDLTNTYIANNFCQTSIADNDIYKNNLLGFWPSTSVDPGGKTIADVSGNNHPLVIDTYNSGTFSDITSRVCPLVSSDLYKTVPNSVDVSVQIYQWLGIAVPALWNLDGKNWIPTYSDIGG